MGKVGTFNNVSRKELAEFIGEWFKGQEDGYFDNWIEDYSDCVIDGCDYDLTELALEIIGLFDKGG